ncbi:hypothetical protein D1872_277470 [compost metagenome]
MCAENITREQDFILDTIRNHRFFSMQVRGFFEFQCFAADIQRIAILYNQEVSRMKLIHFLQFVYSQFCAHNRCMRCSACECCQTAGMIRLCVVNYDVLDVIRINKFT